MANNNDEKNYMPPSVGTILKIAVTADVGDDTHLSDNDVDFECTFYPENRHSQKMTFKKSEMYMIGDDTYVAVVDTSIIGVGKYYCLLNVWIPDADVESGFRKESVRFPTGINVVN